MMKSLTNLYNRSPFGVFLVVLNIALLVIVYSTDRGDPMFSWIGLGCGLVLLAIGKDN